MTEKNIKEMINRLMDDYEQSGIMVLYHKDYDKLIFENISTQQNVHNIKPFLLLNNDSDKSIDNLHKNAKEILGLPEYISIDLLEQIFLRLFKNGWYDCKTHL